MFPQQFPFQASRCQAHIPLPGSSLLRCGSAVSPRDAWQSLSPARHRCTGFLQELTSARSPVKELLLLPVLKSWSKQSDEVEAETAGASAGTCHAQPAECASCQPD